MLPEQPLSEARPSGRAHRSLLTRGLLTRSAPRTENFLPRQPRRGASFPIRARPAPLAVYPPRVRPAGKIAGLALRIPTDRELTLEPRAIPQAAPLRESSTAGLASARSK